MSETVDVLVAGSGAAAFAAALTASHQGASVIMAEKEPLFGGTTAYSAGVIWTPGSRHAREAGLPDDRAEALRYLEAKIGNRLDREKAKVFLATGPQMLDFLEQHTHVRYAVHPAWADYEPTLPGGADGGRSLWPLQFDGRRLGPLFASLRPPLETMMLFSGMMVGRDDLPHLLNAQRSWRSASYVAGILARHALDRLRYARGTRLANGNALIARMALSAQERGIPLWLSSPVVELLVEDGRVAGAVVERQGARVTVRTRKGVVLATGGFPRDLVRRAELYPHVKAGKDHATLPPPGNAGDGARLAGAAGGAFDGDVHHAAAWAPVSLVPQKDGGTRPFPHFIDRGKPGVIAVDRRGRRFVNEAGSYHSFVPAMIEACRDDADVAAWIIADRRALRRYGLGAVPPAPFPIAGFLASGYLIEGRTVGELAARAGIDAAGLQATLAFHDAHAAKGEDPLFNKGSDSYNRFNGDPTHRPNPCLEPLATPPFYAVKLVPGELGTFAGIKTDARAQVVREDGSVVAGLYAAGNDMASVMGGTYPGAGITIGPALTFGYIAGRDLMG